MTTPRAASGLSPRQPGGPPADPACPPPRLSVVIPMYNSAGTLEACLAALESQTLPRCAFEILVVDNNSTDGSTEIARRFQQVRLLREPEQGAYAARNRALAAARGSVLVFTDPDCIPDPDWLEQIDERMQDPEAMIIVGAADAAGASRACRLLSLYERHKDAQSLNSADVRVYYGHTNNMAVRRSVFEAGGPFHRCMRGGDTICVQRAAERFGPAAVRYVGPIRVRHLEIASAADYFRKVRTYAVSSLCYRAVVDARPLSFGERLSVLRSAVQREGLSLLDAARLAGLLALGMAHWQFARAHARLLGPPEDGPPPPRTPRPLRALRALLRPAPPAAGAAP